MGNSSETGGYLPPDFAAGLPEDTSLEDVFQLVLVALTGLPGQLVRPAWQPVLPKQPEPDITWCAFGVTVAAGDANPAMLHLPADHQGAGADLLLRHELLTLFCSFYGPAAQKMASMLRDSLAVSQNNATLQAACSIGLRQTGQITAVPELVNQQWLRRYDLPVIFSRQISRRYPISTLLSSPPVGLHLAGSGSTMGSG